MKLLELKDYNGIIAFNVFHHLMFGLKCLPSYMGETYEQFFGRIELMSDSDKEKMIREAALFVKLEKEDIQALICFVPDPNGVPYGKENLKNLSPGEIYEIIVAVALEVSKIKVNLISDSEKKKSKTALSTYVAPTSSGLMRRLLNWLISLF